jgi:hypothetical protein
VEQTAKNLRDQNARSKSQKSRSENSAAGSNRLNLCTISRVNGEHNNYRLNTFQAIKYTKYLHLKNTYFGMDHRRKALIEPLNGLQRRLSRQEKEHFRFLKNPRLKPSAGLAATINFERHVASIFRFFEIAYRISTFHRHFAKRPFFCRALFIRIFQCFRPLHAMDQALSSL